MCFLAAITEPSAASLIRLMDGAVPRVTCKCKQNCVPAARPPVCGRDDGVSRRGSGREMEGRRAV